MDSEIDISHYDAYLSDFKNILLEYENKIPEKMDLETNWMLLNKMMLNGHDLDSSIDSSGKFNYSYTDSDSCELEHIHLPENPYKEQNVYLKPNEHDFKPNFNIILPEESELLVQKELNFISLSDSKPFTATSTEISINIPKQMAEQQASIPNNPPLLNTEQFYLSLEGSVKPSEINANDTSSTYNESKSVSDSKEILLPPNSLTFPVEFLLSGKPFISITDIYERDIITAKPNKIENTVEIKQAEIPRPTYTPNNILSLEELRENIMKTKNDCNNLKIKLEEGLDLLNKNNKIDDILKENEVRHLNQPNVAKQYFLKNPIPSESTKKHTVIYKAPSEIKNTKPRPRKTDS